ncbi:MAG: xanthine dehydrogenase accessory factor [Nocardioidaceae bacterium]|jgi:xanthine dehydrogenase accessory factor|nr:xanthine dehydrogenase accessory factor [Nocardioidaceae bacterium]
MTTTQIRVRMAELTSSRVPFVHATVVRAQEPSSAHAGDQAIVLADGSIEGFVGGQCAAGSVRTAALDVLDSGTSLLLRVLPDANDAFPESPGASIVVNPCLSGGAVEIFLEPLLPSPALYLVGTSPTADAVAALAPTLGFVVERAAAGATPDGALAAVVSSHGGDEVGAIRAALDAGVGFVGLVCSHTRGEALLEELDLPEQELRRVYTHVGIDIGARTAPEIALSIMAAIVRSVRLEGLTAPPRKGAPVRAEQVLDPVCGMTVTVATDAPHAVVASVDHWFCSSGCRDAYLQAHQA